MEARQSYVADNVTYVSELSRQKRDDVGAPEPIGWFGVLSVQKEVIEMEGDTVQVSRIYRFNGDSKVKAFVDILVSGLVIKGLRIVNGKKGLFLSMPQQQGKDGKWYNAVYPVSKEVRQSLNELVLAAYEE